MTGHTKEPWLLSGLTVYTLRPCKWLGRDSVENEWFATVQPDGKHLTPTAELEANARRIVACVNALANIPDPAAYVAAFEGMREALEGLIECVKSDGDLPDIPERLRLACAAIDDALAAARQARGEA